jgi:zinc transporter, ZIP family
MAIEDLAAFARDAPFAAGVAASFVGGTLATALGAGLVYLVRDLSARLANALLAFAAGIMLAATVFSLLLPGVSAAEPIVGAGPPAALAMIGGASLWAVHRFVPHEHFTKGAEGPQAAKLARIWLFVIAITVHNFPEGLSIGFGAASGDARVGAGVTLGIALQNIPEGLAVAVALLGQGYSRAQSFLVGASSGAVELVGGAIGAGLLQISAVLLPGALGFAAGAMLFVISNEVIPETHREPYADSATAALFAGFALMFVLDTTLA